MAKKARKAAAKRGKKTSKKSKVKKSKAKVAKKVAKKAKPARAKKKAARKAKPPTLGERISSGYHAVIDTVTGTGALRKKMEQPGSDETE